MDPRRHKPLPSNPCAWGWGQMDRIYSRIGATGTTIPKSKHGRYRIDGWTVVVKRSKATGARKISSHRIFVEVGGRLIPAGRVQQALCLRKLHKARKFAKTRRGPGGRFKYYSRWE